MMHLGQWVLPKMSTRISKKRHPHWHWVHKKDSTTYCGVRAPADPETTEPRWNPLIRCCRKCLERIGREGY
jgi:hypothetical protein